MAQHPSRWVHRIYVRPGFLECPLFAFPDEATAEHSDTVCMKKPHAPCGQHASLLLQLWVRSLCSKRLQLALLVAVYTGVQRDEP